MINLIGAIFGIIIGALITWYVTDYYKRATEDLEKASRELEEETEEMRRLNKNMLLGMEHAGWKELSRNEEGKITGFRQTIYLQGIETEESFRTPTIIQTNKVLAQEVVL